MKKTSLILILFLIISVLPVFPVQTASAGVAPVIVWDSSNTHKTLKKKEVFRVKAIIKNGDMDQEISYRSSNDKVAVVDDNGRIEALKKGTAVIRAYAKGAKSSPKFYIHVGKKVKKITVKKSRKTFYRNKKYKIRVSFSPKKAAYKKAIFRSTNPKVAKVSKRGVVKPKRNGKARIIIRSADQSKAKVTVRIVVKTHVTKIKAVAPSHTCFVKKKLKLKKKIYPKTASNKRVKWKSSNKKIATVSSKGVVRGKKIGKVKITAVTTDGSKKKTSYKVTVRKNFDYKKHWFIAHRGYAKKYPENTIEAFKAADQEDFNAIETDLWYRYDFYDADNTKQDNEGSEENLTSEDGQSIENNNNENNKNENNNKENTDNDNNTDKNNTSNDSNTDGTDNDNQGIDPNDTTDSDHQDDQKDQNTAADGDASIDPAGSSSDGSSVDPEGTIENQQADDHQSEPIRTDRSEFIVMHDSNLLRTCGVKLKLKKLTSKNIGEFNVSLIRGKKSNKQCKIPVLSDYLDVMKDSDKTLTIELKNKKLSLKAAGRIIDKIDKYELSSRTRICSFNKVTLQNIKKVLGDRDDIKLTKFVKIAWKKDVNNIIKWCSKNGIDEVSVNHKIITRKMVKNIKRKKMLVGTYTVDNKGRAAELIAMGCDHITTNEVLW